MKRAYIALIIIGSIATTLGATLLTIGIVKESKENKLVSSVYPISESFNSFNINVDTTNIEIKHTEDGSCRVEIDERSNVQHSVTVADDALCITYKDASKWYENFFNFYQGKMKATIYVPEGEYTNLTINTSTGNIVVNKEFLFDSTNVKASTGSVKFYASVVNTLNIETSTGDIHVGEGTATTANLKASTGDITLLKSDIDDIVINTSTGKQVLNEVVAVNLNSSASTGSLKLINTIIDENINIKRSTGDVTIVDSNCSGGDIETSTGDVDAIFLTSKIVYATTDTGHVNIPHLGEGGVVNIKTSTGDIDVKIKQQL